MHSEPKYFCAPVGGQSATHCAYLPHEDEANNCNTYISAINVDYLSDGIIGCRQIRKNIKSSCHE